LPIRVAAPGAGGAGLAPAVAATIGLPPHSRTGVRSAGTRTTTTRVVQEVLASWSPGRRVSDGVVIIWASSLRFVPTGNGKLASPYERIKLSAVARGRPAAGADWSARGEPGMAGHDGWRGDLPVVAGHTPGARARVLANGRCIMGIIN